VECSEEKIGKSAFFPRARVATFAVKGATLARLGVKLSLPARVVGARRVRRKHGRLDGLFRARDSAP
jgi:hypothetical protein